MKYRKIFLAQLNGENYVSGVGLRSGDYANKINQEPLGLEYIGAQIADEYDVKIVLQENKSDKDLFEEIRKFKPDVVGFSVFTFAAPSTQRFCKKIKNYNKKIITVVGGCHPSGFPQMVKDENIDFAVIGEGEATFRELIKTLERGRNVSGVEGIAFWNNGLKITKSRERIKNLDRLKSPLRVKKSVREKFFSSITYSRGCPFGCSFCDSKKIWGNQVFWRSPKNVVAEIKELKKMGAREFYFTDLTFNLNKKKVLELCAEIIKEKLSINYGTMCTPRLMDREVLEAMKNSGCRRIQYGIETFDKATLQTLGGKKEAQVFSRIKKTLNLTSSVGIHMRNFFMIGYPTDDRDKLLKIRKALNSLYGDIKKSKSPAGDIRITFFTPFPTQSLYENYKNKGWLLTEDFSKYTTNIPVVRCGISPNDLIRIRDDIYRDINKR